MVHDTQAFACNLIWLEQNPRNVRDLGPLLVRLASGEALTMLGLTVFECRKFCTWTGSLRSRQSYVQARQANHDYASGKSRTPFILNLLRGSIPVASNFSDHQPVAAVV